MAKKPKFTQRQSAFINAYVDCLNGAEAARRAGYSIKSAKVQASNLFKKPKIRKEVDRRIRLRSRMSTDEIIARLEAQASADISMFFKPGTLEIDAERIHQHGNLLHSVMLTADGFRIRVYDSQKALELLGKSRALFVERTVLEQMEGMDIVDSEDVDGKDTPNPHPASSRKAKRD